jgi:hypothetical protein
MASKGYFWTDDPDVAAKDPKAVLEVIDPGTGRGVMKFTKEQDQAATDFMMQQFLGMIDVKETKASTGQIQRQDPSAAVLDRADKIKDAKNFGENLGIALKSPDEEKRNNAIKYLGQKSGRQVKISNGMLTVADIDGQGESQYDLNTNPDELASALISAFGIDLPEDTILKSAKSTLRGNSTNVSGEITAIVSAPTPSAIKVVIPSSAIGMSSTEAAAAIKEALPANFTVEDLTPGLFSGNQVKITAPNTKTFTINTKLTGASAEKVKEEIEDFIKLNNVAAETTPAGAGSTTATGGNVR